jgi:hypothetical protein
MGAFYAKTKANDFSTNFETFLVQFGSFIDSPLTDPDLMRVCPVLSKRDTKSIYFVRGDREWELRSWRRDE